MTEPVRLDPEAIFDDGALRRMLHLPQSAVDRARKSGELRSTRKGGRVLYLGRWVLDWLTGEEDCPRKRERPGRQAEASHESVLIR